jgi:hypothetical protein
MLSQPKGNLAMNSPGRIVPPGSTPFRELAHADQLATGQAADPVRAFADVGDEAAEAAEMIP